MARAWVDGRSVTWTDRSLKQQLSLHLTVFENLLDRAEVAMGRKRVESAAALVAMAVDVASRNHVGRYTDGRVERLLLRIAEHVPSPTVEAEPDVDVVHIVDIDTTRGVEETVRRWENLGVGRSQVVTSPSAEPSVLERAAELRSKLSGARTVVVHSDPSDIAPLLALATDNKPPVVYINHHESSYWPGVSLFDLVVSHRAIGSALAVDRRCVPVGRTMLLPPWAADDEVWTSVLSVIDERVQEVTPALLPPPVLPRDFEERDLDLVRQLKSSDRSDGLLGAYSRHGEHTRPEDRPEVSVLVMASDPDRTIECLHRVLDTWSLTGLVQLIVVDQTSDPEMDEMLDELTGTILGVRADGVDLVATLNAGMKWAWGPFAAIVVDDACPMVGSLEDSLWILDSEPSRSVVPIVGLDEHKPDGVLVRTHAPSGAIEHAFAQVTEGSTEDGRGRDGQSQIRVSLVSPVRGDH